MSRLQQRRRHAEAQIAPLPVLEGGQKPDIKGQDIKERLRRCESDKHKSWDMPVEGFRNHVTTDGSLLRVFGKCGACGWPVVQLDHDEDIDRCTGCTERWMQRSRCSAQSKCGVNVHLASPQGSDRSYDGSRVQLRNH